MSTFKDTLVQRNLDERMELLLNESLPDSLSQLSQRSESFGQVVQYLEDNYIASQRSGKDKMLIEEEAKKFVTKGLINVLKDIEVTSMNIDQLLQMQSLSIDSLTSDVSLIRSRLHGMKSQHLNASLDEMKIPYSVTSQIPVHMQTSANTTRLSVREVDVDYARRVHDASDEASQGQSTTITGSVGITEDDAVQSVFVSNQKRQKISMEERLSRLDSVGVGSSNRKQ